MALNSQPPVKTLTIELMHGRQNVYLDFKDSISIFMGPNGVGKSTILNIFVHTLSRQWSRLAKIPFKRVSIEFNSGDEISVTREDCLNFNLSDFPVRVRL